LKKIIKHSVLFFTVLTILLSFSHLSHAENLDINAQNNTSETLSTQSVSTLQSGWVYKDGKWYYYIPETGKMAVGWMVIDGVTYYFNDQGVMKTGWLYYQNRWYYFANSGAMQVGWIQYSSKWYYLNSNGEMVTGWQKISGKWYLFDHSGAMQKENATVNEKNIKYISAPVAYLYRDFSELSDYTKHLTYYNPSYTRLGTLNFGDTVLVLKEELYSVQVETKFGIGYIHKYYLVDNLESVDWLVKDGRNIRNKPGATDANSLIGYLASGTKVKVLDYRKLDSGLKDWFKIQTPDGTIGWIWGATYESNVGYNVIRYEFDKKNNLASYITLFTPLNSFSNVTAEEINQFINYKVNNRTSVMKNMGHAYIEAQNVSGINPIYLLAHSGLETGWGTSPIVNNKYNFYGIGAIDSNPGENAYTFDSPEGGIIAGALWIGRNYIFSDHYQQSTLDHMRFNNGTHQYATDEAWASKIAYTAQEFYNYIYPNGFELKTGWYKESNGKWYYFNSNGKMHTGWLTYKGNDYYLKISGHMAQNEWLTINNKTYYFNNDGLIHKGWLFYNNKWYYLNSDGQMLKGLYDISGKKYYFNNDGSMASDELVSINGDYYYFEKDGYAFTGGWKEIKGKYYYFNTDGKAHKGWLDWNSNKYYFKNNGMMAENEWINDGVNTYFMNENGHIHKGWLVYNGKKYYLDQNGLMLKNTWFKYEQKWYYFMSDGTARIGWLQDGSYWYYFDVDGVMKTGWLLDKGKWYYLDGSGKMLASQWLYYNGTWYYLNPSGVMQVGWLQDNGKWYYFNSGGAMVKGWLQYKNEWYYLSGSGYMVTGWQYISGKWYYFYDSGVMAANTTIDGYKLGPNGAWIK